MRRPDPPDRTAIPLGEIAAKIPQLEMICRRCGRHGKLSTARLVLEHGPDFPATRLWEIVAADCPNRHADWTGRCQVEMPELPRYF